MMSAKAFTLGLLAFCSLSAASLPKTLLLDASLAGSAIVTVGEHGAAFRSADFGHTWEKCSTPTHATLTGVSFANALRGWAVGHDATLLFTDDGGLTWAQQKATDDLNVSFLDVLAANAREAIIVGAYGICYYTQDIGHTWHPLKLLDEDLHLNRITRLPSGRFLVLAEKGHRILIAENDFSHQPLPRPYAGSLYGATSLADGSQIAIGLRSHVLVSPDTESTPRVLTLEPAANLFTAVQIKSGTLVLAGHARALFTSVDHGKTFQLWDVPALTTCVTELLEIPDGSLLAFGEAGVTRLPAPPAPTAIAAPTPASQLPTTNAQLPTTPQP